MKSEAMLPGILPNNMERTSQVSFKYMLTAAKVILVMKWKTEECPTIQIWGEGELAEYSIMAN